MLPASHLAQQSCDAGYTSSDSFRTRTKVQLCLVPRPSCSLSSVTTRGSHFTGALCSALESHRLLTPSSLCLSSHCLVQ